MSKKIIETSEELEFINSIEAGNYTTLNINDKNNLEKILKKASQNTINKLTRKKPINIRLSEADISRLKSISLNKGLPYQTFISQVLHNYVRGKTKQL